MITKTIRLIIILVFLQGYYLRGRANVSEDWRQTAADYLSQNVSGFGWSRGMAMVHVAEFDAVNAVLGGFTPYALNVAAPTASPDAAAAQAAYTILTNLSRANHSILDAALAKSLAGVAEGPAKQEGILLGKLAAEAIIRLRASDNTELAISAEPSTAVGRWRPAPPDLVAGVGAQFRYLAPFTMRSASQFRPGPPPPLNSEQYAADYNEVRLRGGSNSTNRTAAEVLSARSRDEGLDYLTDVLAQHPLPLLETTRVLALFYMALADAGTSVFEAKYVYKLWRPVTAIRAGAADGNDATPPETTWTSFLPTHPHPEYPSALNQNAAAMIEVLISVYGDNFALQTTWPGSTEPRVFERLSDIVQDGIEARISGGTHFRTACTVAVDVGRRVAQHALQNFLRPRPNVVSGQRLAPGEFQLSLTTGRISRYIIETSSNLLQWDSWRTNTYGMIIETDVQPAPDRRFYRATLLP